MLTSARVEDESRRLGRPETLEDTWLAERTLVPPFLLSRRWTQPLHKVLETIEQREASAQVGKGTYMNMSRSCRLHTRLGAWNCFVGREGRRRLYGRRFRTVPPMSQNTARVAARLTIYRC